MLSTIEAVFLACGTGDVKRLRRLLVKRFNPNTKDLDGWTPLMFAVRGGHLEVVESLLAAGADPSIPDDNGITAIDWASLCGHEKIRKLLADKNLLANAV